MNAKLILLNLLLLAALAGLTHQFREQWQAARLREQKLRGQMVKPVPPVMPPPAPAVSPVAPANYVGVAQNMLFAKDRNPNVIVEVVPPPAPPPMPALPSVYGYMNFGEPAIILSERQGVPQRAYRAGEKVGEFKLLAFNHQEIALEWNGQVVKEKIEKLRPKERTPEAATQQVASLPVAPNKPAVVAPAPPGPGRDMGGEVKACVAGDSSPAGTVVDGMKKVVTQSPFGGPVCRWEPAR